MDNNDPQLRQAINSKNRLVTRFERYPIWIGALVGATSSAVLPIIVVVWKIDLCNIQMGEDISGVFICIPPFMAIGAAAGVFVGTISKKFSQILKAMTDIKRPQLIGGIITSILTALARFVISLVPALMLWFPDC